MRARHLAAGFLQNGGGVDGDVCGGDDGGVFHDVSLACGFFYGLAVVFDAWVEKSLFSAHFQVLLWSQKHH